MWPMNRLMEYLTTVRSPGGRVWTHRANLTLGPRGLFSVSENISLCAFTALT